VTKENSIASVDIDTITKETILFESDDKISYTRAHIITNRSPEQAKEYFILLLKRGINIVRHYREY